MPAIVSFLGEKKFLVGENPTYVDFYFVEIIELLVFVTEGKVLEDYPTLKTYHANVLGLPNVAAKHEEQKKLIFNNKVAKINNM